METRTVDYVFLHGGAQGSWVWKETIEALRLQSGACCGRVLTLDVPGCGDKRGRYTDSLSLEDVVDDLLADVLARGLQEFILVGHSQAGTLLPRLAARRPELLRHLVYVSCIAPAPGKTVLQQMGSGPHGSDPDEVGWPFDPQVIKPESGYHLMFCNDMTERAGAAFLAKLGSDSWPAQTMLACDWRYDHLGSIPSTYVICLQDQILPAPWQGTFAARFKTQRQVRIDVGHQVMNTRPHSLAEVLSHL